MGLELLVENVVLLLGVHKPISKVVDQVIVGLELQLASLSLLEALLLHGFQSLWIGLDGGAASAILDHLTLARHQFGSVPLLLFKVLGLIDLASQHVDLLDKQQVLVHDVAILILVNLVLLLESLLQGSLGSVQVSSLVILLLLDVLINLHVLRVLRLDVLVEVLVDDLLQLLKVVDVLHDPVDIGLHQLDVDVVLDSLEPVSESGLGHHVLLGLQLIDKEAKTGVESVVVTQLVVHLLGLTVQLNDLSGFGSDVLSQVFDLVVQHELELLEFLGLLLEGVDLVLLVTDLGVFLIDLLLHGLDVSLQLSLLLSLELELLLFSDDLSVELVDLNLQIRQLGSGHKQLSIGSELHVLHLSHVLLVLLLDVILLLMSILNNLVDNLSKVLLHRVNLTPQLLSGGSLSIHSQLVPIHESMDVHVVSLDRISNDLLERLPLILLVFGQVLEVSGRLKHVTGVDLPMLLELGTMLLRPHSDLLFLISDHLPHSLLQGVKQVPLSQGVVREVILDLSETFLESSLLRDLIVVLLTTSIMQVVEVRLQLITVVLLLLELLLFSQDLISEWQDFPFLALVLRITVLNLVDDKGTILSNSEQLVVVVGKPHTLNRLPMSLDFGQPLELQGVLSLVLSNLVDDDTTGLIGITDTSKQGLRVVGDCQLLKYSLSLVRVVLLSVVVDQLVRADTEELVLSVGNVDHRGDFDVLLQCEVHISDPGIVLGVNKIPLIHLSTERTGDETHVVIEPVDSSDSLSVALAEEVLRRIVGNVEWEHLGGAVALTSGKQVASMVELELSASLDLKLSELLQSLGKDVHADDLVIQGNDDMEATRMEGNGEALLLEGVEDLTVP